MKNQINILLKEACERGLTEGVYSGVSAAVSVIKNKVRYRGWFSGGLTRFDQSGVPVEVSTPFDLASLTKPLCTTLCTLHLIASGKMHWDDATFSLLDTCPPLDKKNISIRDILTHSSGLPAYKPYFKEFYPQPSKDNTYPILQKIVDEPLQYFRGTTSVYSDLGFILLGLLLEKVAQISLDQLYRERITEPLDLAGKIFFMPSNSKEQTERTKMAATEDCPWRKRIIQGEAHDEHCWLMDGVAGHAGLFGTAGGVLSLCECLLDCWQERASHPAFANNLLRYALNWKQPGESWRLGFDTPSSGRSSSGRYFSPKSVGHLGFTGTSFWIDPEQNVIVVLLTNRVHPSRENIKIREFRPFFHDFLMEKICG
jgi:CubicO group peptidase (beta-lactamase class C family)